MYVYFIQAAIGGPIKIGKADRPDRRLAQLQTGNPENLVIRAVCLGGFIAERELQVRFTNDLIRNEWYNPSEAIVSLIDSLPTWEAVSEGAPCPEIVQSDRGVLYDLFNEGYSYLDIGELLGCTRQRAHQIIATERFNRKELPARKNTAGRPSRPQMPIEQAYRERLAALPAVALVGE